MISVEEDNNSIVANFRAARETKQKPLVLLFFSSLYEYIAVRFVQIVRIIAVFLGLSVAGTAGLKSFVVRKMYWGRTSFYRSSFQFFVVVVTIGTLLASISTRTDIFATEEAGIIASSGAIGNNDIFLQVGTTESIVETTASNVDYSILKYTVKSGDTLSTIAKEFEISQDTIRWANNIPSGRDTLTVGQVLDIPPMNGVLYTVKSGDNLDSIIKKTKGANKFDLIELNNLVPPDYKVSVNQKLFIPDATYNPPVVASSSGGASYVNLGNTAVNVAPGTFVNPLLYCPGYKFVRGWRYSHTGVDLSKSGGCPINSIGSGTILKAGWCGGSMGFCTVIRHDNGYSSVYMHGSGTYYVHSGQRVGAGQKIMYMGCTGRCSGTHLHLSIAPPGVDVVSNYYGRINPAGIVPY
ncbi:M23 family metallopeptidase [Candidatus Dojkabacteria bacterium]|nr:M23 family metallopeptidase [Candidatus Dojkabacteria bacterium]